MADKLSKGTVVVLQGTKHPVILAEDAKIEEVPDQTYVGLLIGNRHNHALNIGNVEGDYNPVTGAAEEPEPVPSDDPGVGSGPPRAEKKATKKKASKKGASKADEK